MANKKQTGGIQSPDLISPGDDAHQNVLNTQQENPLSQPIELNMDYHSGTGIRIDEGIDYESYTKYIDRPFSFISDDPDDMRAYNQSAGEKMAYGLPKLVTRIGTNILGSTVGLVYGGGAFLGGLFDGPEGENATKNFFDNDFQRGLDGVNDWMDGALPHYYTKEEKDYNFWQSMGTANFWANDFSQGLSFVAGAVLSEYLTAGLASSAIAARGAQLLQKMGRATGASKGLKYLAAGASDDIGKQAARDLLARKRLGNMAVTMRQLGTGAMYEAGVEARHHYDQTMTNLENAFRADYGRDPNVEEMASLVDIATKSSNAVFGANVALVGYGNYMMFPKIFGRGFNGNKNLLKGKFKYDTKKGFSALYKDVSKSRAFANHAWRYLKVPLYEGFVEEGGQKLADLSGQQAAEYFYRSKEDPWIGSMVGQLIQHTNDAFADAYGSNEGQKEIGIGFILAALGLPGAVAKTDAKGDVIKDKITGKVKTGFGGVGGVWQTRRSIKHEKKMIDAHVERLNKDKDLLNALSNASETLIRGGVSQDEIDFGMIVNSPFQYKNAEFDNIFNFINSRLKAGYEGQVLDQIDNIRTMTVQEFRDAFNWNDLNDLNDQEIKDKQTELVKMMEERVTSIKETRNEVNRSFINYNEDVKDGIVHALATGENMDQREGSVNDRIKAILEKAGVDMEVEQELDSRSIRDERAEISLKDRIKRVWSRMTPKQRSKVLALPESKTIMRKMGIESFTDPTHLEELAFNLFSKQKEITDKISELEADPLEPMQAVYDENGKNIGGTVEQQEKWAKLENLKSEFDKINKKTTDLMEAINKGLDPDLSASEQILLDRYQKADPQGYSKNKEELTQLLKDSHRIRARRHRMLTMVNELMDYRDYVKQPGNLLTQPFTKATPGVRVPLPKMLAPKMVRNKAAENAEDIADLQLKRLFTKYQGKIIEFEYTKADTKTKEGLLQIAREAGIEDKIVQDAADIVQKNPKTDELTALSIALKSAGISLTGPETGIYRVYVKPGKVNSESDNMLIRFPTKENVDLIIERRELEKLEGNAKAKKRIEEIDKLLKGPGNILQFKEHGLNFLRSAKNIREVDSSVQIKEMIDSATESSRAEIQNELEHINTQLDKFVDDAEKLATELIEAEALRVKERQKKGLAKKVFNLANAQSQLYEKIQGLELQKAQLTAKLNDLNELARKIKEAEATIENLDTLSLREKREAIGQAVAAKIKEHIQEKWQSDSEILEKYVKKGFFKDVELLSDMFQTEEDNSKLLDLANIVFDFVQNMGQLPEELVYLLDEGAKDAKFRWEQAQPLLKKLKNAIHFKKDGITYDARFRGATEAEKRTQFESILTEVHELKMKYESAVENLRLKLQSEMSPLFEEVNKEHAIIDKIKLVNDLFVTNYNAVSNLIAELTTPEADITIDPSSNPRTQGGQMTDEELERDITLNEKAYYNSPSIKQVELAKTAGNHLLAEKEYARLMEKSKKEKLNKAEQENLEHYIDQLNFFEWTARSNNDKSDTLYKNHNLLTITRKNILEFDARQSEAENKIAHLIGFYDHTKSKGDKARYSKAVDKNGKPSKFSENALRDESKEDIILLVVDHVGRPVKLNGRLVYSNMMGTETYRSQPDNNGTLQQVYRYGRADLIKVNGSVPSFKVNNKVFYTGQMSEESKGILAQHKSFRNNIIQEGALAYLPISGKSHGMQIYGEQGPEHKGMARSTIVKQESDVKNINLNVSVNPLDKVSINARQYTVKAGFIYASKDGNLVRFKINTLPKDVQNNVYNMLRLLATQVEDAKLQNTNFTPQTAYMFPNVDKSIIKQLSDFIYFGKHAKGRALSKYSIYTEGDTLYYGGRSITFAQLKNTEAHPEAHAELKSFLENLHVQVNARNLHNKNLKQGPLGDVEVRKENGKAISAWYKSLQSGNIKIAKYKKKNPKRKNQNWKQYNKEVLIKAGLTNKEKLALKSKKPTAEYEKYLEVRVDANLSVTYNTWDNYTHFLMGTKSNNGFTRSVHDIPVTVNMREDTHSRTTNNESYTNPQFRNIYLIYNKNVRNTNLNDLKNPQADPVHDIKDINDLVLDDTTTPEVTPKVIEGVAPSGVEEGKEYIFTNPDKSVKTKVHFKVNSVDHTTGFVDHTVLALYKADGTIVEGTDQWTNELRAQFGEFFYLEDYAKHLSRSAVKQTNLEVEEDKKKQQNTRDIKDLLKPSEDKDTTGEDIDGASLSASSLAAMQEDYQLMDLYEEYQIFKGMVPKNNQGQPIFDVNIVQGLIHGKDYGYFTKTGEILLSTEAVRGAIYHEAFHGITYNLLSREERAALYDEVRGIRGKQKTYKGEVKSLKNFTDIEADEWLAEEFREYVLTKGNYKVGSKVKKSLIQKLFDFIFKFFSNLSNTNSLFKRIHTGYYNNAVEEYTTYNIAEALQGRKGASMSKHRINSGTLRDLNSGVTVALFDMIHQDPELGIEDILSLKVAGNLLANRLNEFYGTPGDHGKRESVNSRLVEQVRQKRKGLRLLEDTAIVNYNSTKDNKYIEELKTIKKDIGNLDSVETVLIEEWDFIKSRNLQYLKQYKLNIENQTIAEILEEETEEDALTRDTLGMKSWSMNEIDLKTLVHPSIKLLLGTLPKTVTNSVGESLIKDNKSGVYQMASFGEVMNTLYKHLSNKSGIEESYKELVELANENKTYKVLLKRLGIEQGLDAVKQSDYSINQLRMLMSFIKTFNTSNEEYVTLLAKQSPYNEHPGRFFNDSNTEKAENTIKLSWNYNFKANLRNTPYGKTLKDGRIVLDINKKFTIGNKRATLKGFSKANLGFNDMVPLLQMLGIKFSNPSKLIKFYEEGRLENFMENASWILAETVKAEGDVSSLFGRNVEGNLKTLIGYELDTTNLAVTLQHVNPLNQVVHGVTRKNYVNLLVDKLNKDEVEIERLLATNPYMFGSLYADERIIKVRTLEGGKDIHKGQGHDISKTTEANIAAAHITSILEGYTPLIRTGNKKMEKSVQIGKNRFRTEQEMISYLTNLLKAEILTANEIFNNKELQQVAALRNEGKRLQFFNKTTSFQNIVTGSNSFIAGPRLTQDNNKLNTFLEKDIVQTEIKEFLLEKEKEALELLQNFNFISVAKKGLWNNLGIEEQHIQEAYTNLSEKEKLKAITTNGNITLNVIENIARKIAHTQLIGIIEQTRLFLGHPALYGKDIFKRTSGMVGTKVYPVVNPDILEAMNIKLPSGSLATNNKVKSPHIHRDTVRFITREEPKKDSIYIEKYVNRLEQMGRSDVAEAVVNKFTGMDIFDGGGFISLDFYRSVLFMTDNWSNRQEAAYQRLVQNEQLDRQSLALFPPLKPQVFADSLIGGINVKLFNKFALYPIHPNLSKLTQFQGEVGNTVMDDIYDDMLINNIDYMVFESSTKVGAKQNQNFKFEPALNEQGQYTPLSTENESYVHTYPLEYFGIQLDPTTKPKNNVRVGTQSATMLFMNVFNEGFLDEKLAPYSETFKRLDAEYHAIHRTMIEKDKSILARKLGFRQTPVGFEFKGDKESMRNSILSEMSKRDIPEHLKDTVDELFSKENELAFTNLLANKQRIDDLLYAIVTNTVVARKTNGTMSVLQSDVGFEFKREEGQIQTDKDLPGYRPLKFYDFAKDGSTVAMEVYLPHYMKDEYGDNVDINDFTEQAKEMIGFRIPTEGLNSIEFIKVAGFLPASMGATVVVPHEMVAKSGADFDIDKLTLYLPHVERTEDGKVDLVQDIAGPGQLALEDVDAFKSAVLKLFDTNSKELESFIKEFDKGDTEFKEGMADGLLELGWNNLDELYTQSTKVVQNRLLESMKNILRHPMSFPQLISPVGAFELRDTAHEIHDAQVDSNILGVVREPGGLFDQFTISNLIKTTYQMYQTIGGTGIVATSITDLAKSQRSGFRFKPESVELDEYGVETGQKEQYLLNFEGLEDQAISLSRVYDTQGNYINRSMQQYVTAYVDGEKDPFAMYVNAGQSGAAIHMLLIRAGVPLKTVLKFMSQPVIQEYYRLKNLQSIVNTTSPYSVDLNEKSIVGKINKMIGSTSGKAMFNEDMLDKHDIINGKRIRSRDSMLITNLADMVKGQKSLQAQEFQDYLQYKNYAELARKAQQLAAFDTKRLKSGYNLIYLDALERHLKHKNVFEGLDAKTGPSSLLDSVFLDPEVLENPPFISSLKSLYKQAPQLFKPTDLKEAVKFTDGAVETNPVKLKMLTIAEQAIQEGKSRDEIMYLLRAFDNYLTAWIWHTRAGTDLKTLNSRIGEMFQGENSLPNRVGKAKVLYGDNILIQDLAPILLEFESGLNIDNTVDKLQLGTKKYSSSEVDDLADAWYELYHMGGEAQQLADDILIFSLLKSGSDFHPSSFFHALPGVAVINKVRPMVKAIYNSIHNVPKGKEYFNKHTVDNLYEDFLSNSWDNPRIVRHIYNSSHKYKAPAVYTKDFKDERITILSLREQGERKGLVGPEDKYYKTHFKRVSFDSETGLSLYKRTHKKGLLGHLKEVTQSPESGDITSSIIEVNNHPFGRQLVQIPTKVINKIKAGTQQMIHFKFDVNDPNMVMPGVITTQEGVNLEVERELTTDIKSLYTVNNYRKFDVKDKAALQLKLSQLLGYKSWAELSKDSYNKPLLNGEFRQIFSINIINDVESEASSETNDQTEQPVTQNLKDLKSMYNNQNC